MEGKMLRVTSIRATCSVWVTCAIWFSVIIACLACSDAQALCVMRTDTNDGVNYTTSYTLQPGEVCRVNYRDPGQVFQGSASSSGPGARDSLHCGSVNFDNTGFSYTAGFRRTQGLPCTDDHVTAVTAPATDPDNPQAKHIYDATFTVQAVSTP